MGGYCREERLKRLEQLLRFYCMIRSFAGITFSELIPDEERRSIATQMSALFMGQADRVTLPF